MPAQHATEERNQEEKEGYPSHPDPEASGGSGRVWRRVVVLLVVPGILYATIPVVAFLPLFEGSKIWVSAGLVVAAETTFIVSALFLGREVVTRYRRFFDPRTWFRKR